MSKELTKAQKEAIAEEDPAVQCKGESRNPEDIRHGRYSVVQDRGFNQPVGPSRFRFL